MVKVTKSFHYRLDLLRKSLKEAFKSGARQQVFTPEFLELWNAYASANFSYQEAKTWGGRCHERFKGADGRARKRALYVAYKQARDALDALLTR